MTAIVAYIQSSVSPSATLLVDGNAFANDVISPDACFSAPKVLTIPHLRAALAIAGNGAMASALAMRLCAKAATFDDLPAVLGDALREIDAEWSGAHREGIIIVAGFSEAAAAPKILAITNGGGLAGVAPYTAVDAGTFFALPAGMDELKAMRVPADTNDIVAEVDGMRFMQVLATSRLTGTRGVAVGDVVGGPVTETVVYRDRIEQRVVGRLA